MRKGTAIAGPWIQSSERDFIVDIARGRAAAASAALRGAAVIAATVIARVIMATAAASPFRTKRMLERGCVAVLGKPLDETSFVAAARTALGLD